jgi:hypothetical protein
VEWSGDLLPRVYVVLVRPLVHPIVQPLVTFALPSTSTYLPPLHTMQADPATLQLLSQTLTSTVSPDKATRRAAEEQLKTGETQPGFLLLVLELVKSDQVEVIVRQAAGVYFKNAVKRLWEPEEVCGQHVCCISRWCS